MKKIGSKNTRPKRPNVHVKKTVALRDQIKNLQKLKICLK